MSEWAQQGDADRSGDVTDYERYKEAADHLRRCVEICLTVGDSALGQLCFTAYQQARQELDGFLNTGLDGLAQSAEA